MKIVYISNSIIPSKNANSIHVMKMCQAFADNGHEVILLAPLHKDNISNINIFDYYGVRNNFKIKFISFINIPKLWSFSYAMNTYRYIKQLKVDIVYGRDLKSCYLGTKVNESIKVIYEPHKPFGKHNVIDKIVLKLMIQQNSFIKLVVISDSLKSMYKKITSFKNCKIDVAHDGADKPKDNKKITSIKNSQRLNVGYTGHLYQGRGIDIILEIAKKIDYMNFHIVGGNLIDIEFWKSKTSLKNVIFHGFVEPSEVYKYVNSFDIMLAPYQNKVSIAGKDDSSKYMSPLKIFEYMASKKAIVISDLDVLHEVLNNDEVIYVKYNNILQWVDAIKKLENNNDRNNLSLNSYNKFINNYTWNQRSINVIK